MTSITEIKDVTKLQGMVSDLWCLLDDIDTLDDACKSNNEEFRNLTRDTQQRRHKILTSDGYNLHLPKANIEDETNKPGLEDVAKAFAVIERAMIDDNDYAHTWHCNIAMCCYDTLIVEGVARHDSCREVANETASRFMKLCFDVETKA